MVLCPREANKAGWKARATECKVKGKGHARAASGGEAVDGHFQVIGGELTVGADGPAEPGNAGSWLTRTTTLATVS